MAAVDGCADAAECTGGARARGWGGFEVRGQGVCGEGSGIRDQGSGVKGCVVRGQGSGVRGQGVCGEGQAKGGEPSRGRVGWTNPTQYGVWRKGCEAVHPSVPEGSPF